MEGIEKAPPLAEENIALRIEWEMRRRGWSQERLAKEMADVGYPLHQSAISKIVNVRPDGRRRTISVDEAIGFARVFGVPLSELPMPLEVVTGERIHVLMRRLDVLEDAEREARNATYVTWACLGDLLHDEQTVNEFAQWHVVVKNNPVEVANGLVTEWRTIANRILAEGPPRPPLQFPKDAVITPERALSHAARLERLVAAINGLIELEPKILETWIRHYSSLLVTYSLVSRVAPLINRSAVGSLTTDDIRDVIKEIGAKRDAFLKIADEARSS